jgi:hypothetical protein
LAVEKTKQVVEEFARARGLRLEEVGDALRLWHSEAPVYIEVREGSRGVTVRLGYEGLRDYVREVVDTSDNPREEIEDLVDEMSSIAYMLYEELRRRGVEARLDTRSAAMDILGELEEAEEE